MERARNAIGTVLAIVGAVALVLGVTAVWARRDLVATDRFVEVTEDALDRREVRRALAEAMVDSLLEDAPLVLQRDRDRLVEVAIEVAETERFAVVFRRVVEEAHRRLISGEADRLVLRVSNAVSLLAQRLEDVDPALAEAFPTERSLELLLLVEERTANLQRWADRIRTLSVLLPIVGIAATLAGFAVAERRWLMVSRWGIWVVAVAALAGLAVFLLRFALELRAEHPVTRAGLNVLWDLLAPRLWLRLAVATVIGLVAGVAGSRADRRPRPIRPSRGLLGLR